MKDYIDELRELRDENKQLRESLNMWIQANYAATVLIYEQQAKIERLYKEAKEKESYLLAYYRRVDELNALRTEVESLRKENEQLRISLLEAEWIKESNET